MHSTDQTFHFIEMKFIWMKEKSNTKIYE